MDENKGLNNFSPFVNRIEDFRHANHTCKSVIYMYALAYTQANLCKEIHLVTEPCTSLTYTKEFY